MGSHKLLFRELAFLNSKSTVEKPIVEVTRVLRSQLTRDVEDMPCDNIQEHEDHALYQETKGKKGKKRTRMHNVYDRLGTVPSSRVEYNEDGQPVGDNASKFSNFISTLVKSKISLRHRDWRKVEVEQEIQLWTTLKMYYVVDDKLKDWVMGSAAKKWRDFKSEMELLHTSGSKSHARVSHEMHKNNGYPPHRHEVFMETHKCKKTGAPSSVAAANMFGNADEDGYEGPYGSLHEDGIGSATANLEGKNVILYSVYRDHGSPVAKATILSIDRREVVGGQELGSECCKVVVNYVIKRDVILPRGVGNVTTMGQAQGRCIIWPYKHVSLVGSGKVSGKCSKLMREQLPTVDHSADAHQTIAPLALAPLEPDHSVVGPLAGDHADLDGAIHSSCSLKVWQMVDQSQWILDPELDSLLPDGVDVLHLLHHPSDHDASF
ncbi:hypothetical protein D1007_49463 [Hordeum vulgare]|nr:hypothetical protein D1007_49463 [Hordeum vulgare]